VGFYAGCGKILTNENCEQMRNTPIATLTLQKKLVLEVLFGWTLRGTAEQAAEKLDELVEPSIRSAKSREPYTKIPNRVFPQPLKPFPS
jgi:hypothetical protein